MLSGDVDTELDDGESAHLKVGDGVVQRSTIQNAANDGTAPYVFRYIQAAAPLPDDL